jgi:plasmid stabilization system protein ParE
VTRRIVVASDTAAEIERIDDWWRENRPSARNLFTRELSAAFRTIASLPNAGRSVPRASIDGVRRVLLRRTKFHLYYRFTDDEVQVLLLWSVRHGEDAPI